MSPIPDFTGYLPPGVYVEPDAVPTIAPQGIDPTIVCLIGQGVGYHTYTETVSFASGNSVPLTKEGIDPSSLIVSGRITDPTAPTQTVPYTFAPNAPGATADYSTTVDTSAGLDHSKVTLVRTTDGQIETVNPEVTVTYRYTDSEYHALRAYDDYDAITAMYGQPLDQTTGEIQSPLSMAAQYAMANGANRLYCVALTGVGTIQQQILDGYHLLAGNYEANIVVPLLKGVTDGTAVASVMQQLKGVVESDARDGFLRMVIAGLDQAYDPTTSELATLGAQAGSRRVVIPWPNKLNVYNGVTNKTVMADGFYLGAAYAGMLAARDPQMPLTKKYPIGFVSFPTSIQQALSKNNKNLLSSAGICVTETDRLGRLVVRHGLTSDYSGGVLNREISLVRAQDALYTLVQDTLDNSGLVGTPIVEETSLNVKGVTLGALEQAKLADLIVDYRNLKVRQQAPPTGDPTVIEVKFEYRPAFPLNYILVSFSIDTSTGDSTLTTASDTPITDAANTASATS